MSHYVHHYLQQLFHKPRVACKLHCIIVFSKKIRHYSRSYQAYLWFFMRRQLLIKIKKRTRISHDALLLTNHIVLSVKSCNDLHLLWAKRTKCYPIMQSSPPSTSSAALPHQWGTKTTLLRTTWYAGIVAPGFTLRRAVSETSFTISITPQKNKIKHMSLRLFLIWRSPLIRAYFNGKIVRGNGARCSAVRVILSSYQLLRQCVSESGSYCDTLLRS